MEEKEKKKDFLKKQGEGAFRKEVDFSELFPSSLSPILFWTFLFS